MDGKEKRREPKRITKEMYQVAGPDLTDPRDCAAYLIDLGELVLIDSGAGFRLDRLVQNIEKIGFDPADISTIILTHCHLDHMGGAAQFREKFGSRLVMHYLDARLVEAGDQLRTAAFCFNVFLQPYMMDLKLYGEKGDLSFGGNTLHWINTPGHTPGSICLYLDLGGKRILFAQDISAPLLKEFGCDPAAWVESMAKLYRLNADILCDGHSGAYRPGNRVNQYLDYCINSQYKQGYLPVQS